MTQTAMELAPQRRTLGQTLWMLAAKREYGLAIVLALILSAVSIRNPAFLASQNIRDIFVNCTQPAIVACGVMLVIITGEIDISVGSAIGLLMAIYATLVTNWQWPVALSMLAVLAIGALIGMLNGILVTIVRVPSIIVTLAMLMILQSITFTIMHTGNISLPEPARFFGIGTIFGIRSSIWVMALVLAATAFLIRYTPVGLRIYAVGSNAHAAGLVSISVNRIKIFTFAYTGFLVGVATLVTPLAAIDNGSTGQGFELLVVTCVVVGGVSISGGQGKLIGVFLGVLLLSIQKTVLIFLKLGPGWSNWDRAIQGALILIAVLVDHIASSRSKRSSGGGH